MDSLDWDKVKTFHAAAETGSLTAASEILKISQQAQEIQEKKIKKLREKRDNKLLDKKMKKLRNACENNLNLVPCLIEVAEHGGTVGEIVELMKSVYGEWEESFGI